MLNQDWRIEWLYGVFDVFLMSWNVAWEELCSLVCDDSLMKWQRAKKKKKPKGKKQMWHSHRWARQKKTADFFSSKYWEEISHYPTIENFFFTNLFFCVCVCVCFLREHATCFCVFLANLKGESVQSMMKLAKISNERTLNRFFWTLHRAWWWLMLINVFLFMASVSVPSSECVSGSISCQALCPLFPVFEEHGITLHLFLNMFIHHLGWLNLFTIREQLKLHVVKEHRSEIRFLI